MLFESVVEEFGKRIGLPELTPQNGNVVRFVFDDTVSVTIERCQPQKMAPLFGISISMGQMEPQVQCDVDVLHEKVLKLVHYNTPHRYPLSCGKTGSGMLVLSALLPEEECTVDVLEHVLMYLDENLRTLFAA
ncbi:type III secretion system chaperone family protein [Halodesulfovibrio marinisediminis]|uniref:Tir chaperone protein (CesT) family protein n=1 Tax=Halodesulfovibrio marinisediminis DSM 17456 TaxID=1121457 RepID=A0A1N6I8P6_9BACT|nr:hypothetical protein [Halodesulfovibrio marinisediminis]SIO28391.1 hypothetical protein SAMN02745161_2522 [Halodesulfovibrio marinisediminis DSM 17456]